MEHIDQQELTGGPCECNWGSSFLQLVPTPVILLFARTGNMSGRWAVFVAVFFGMHLYIILYIRDLHAPWQHAYYLKDPNVTKANAGRRKGKNVIALWTHDMCIW